MMVRDGGAMLVWLLATRAPDCARSLSNGYGARPGMGWEGDYQDPTALGPGRGNASYIAAIADFIATAKVGVGNGKLATLQSLGYFYVNPSSSWDEFNRSASGQLVPNHQLYPHGIEPTVRRIHGLGLKYGTYTDRGEKDCDKRPGELHNEQRDANYFAGIGVDWVKDDSCYDTGDEDIAIAHYAAFRDALNATGRPIWFALCGWKPWYASHAGGGNALANSARIGPDTGSGWMAVKKNIDNTRDIGKYAGGHADGGYWNDGSLQLSPGTGCPALHKCSTRQQCGGGADCVGGFCTEAQESSSACMTAARHQSQFSAWVVLGLNLVMTGNLPLIHAEDPETLSTWANAEAIWVNQDAESWTAERFGRRLDSGPNLVPATQVESLSSYLRNSDSAQYVSAHVSECGGEPDLQLWNLTNSRVYNPKTQTYLAMGGCSPQHLIYDGCTFDPGAVTCAGKGNYSHFGFSLEATTGQLKAHYGNNLCVTVSPGSGAVSAATCSVGNATQKWRAVDGQLQNGAHCLTDGAAPPLRQNVTAVYGRPLSSQTSPAAGAYAVLLLNDEREHVEVKCDAECVSAMGLPQEFPDNAFARDLWAHKPIGPFPSVRREGFSVNVPGGGASKLIKLCATAAECASAVVPPGVSAS